MKLVSKLAIILSLTSCQTPDFLGGKGSSFFANTSNPKVWVLSQSENAGVIAYEDYDSKSDGGMRINSLVHCPNFKMVANPIYNSSYNPPSYYVSSNFITPIGGGYNQRGEFHYKCVRR